MGMYHINMVGVKKKTKKKKIKKASTGGHSTRAHRAGKITPTIKKGKWA